MTSYYKVSLLCNNREISLFSVSTRYYLLGPRANALVAFDREDHFCVPL
jgi:hypothetical protein